MTIFYHDGSDKNPFLIKPVPESAKPLKLYTKRYPVNNILYKNYNTINSPLRWPVMVCVLAHLSQIYTKPLTIYTINHELVI